MKHQLLRSRQLLKCLSLTRVLSLLTCLGLTAATFSAAASTGSACRNYFGPSSTKAVTVVSTTSDSPETFPTAQRLAGVITTSLALIESKYPELMRPQSLIVNVNDMGAEWTFFEESAAPDGSGTLEISRARVNQAGIDGIAVHELVHAVLRANWGPKVADKMLIRLSSEELLADFFVFLFGAQPYPFSNDHLRDFSTDFDLSAESIAKAVGELQSLPEFTKTLNANNADENADTHHVLTLVRKALASAASRQTNQVEREQLFLKAVTFFHDQVIGLDLNQTPLGAATLNERVLQKMHTVGFF
jgi:hypothetical protein